MSTTATDVTPEETVANGPPEPTPTPDVNEIAGIVEQEGFVPVWVVWVSVLSIIVAALAWINVYDY